MHSKDSVTCTALIPEWLQGSKENIQERGPSCEELCIHTVMPRVLTVPGLQSSCSSCLEYSSTHFYYYYFYNSLSFLLCLSQLREDFLRSPLHILTQSFIIQCLYFVILLLRLFETIYVIIYKFIHQLAVFLLLTVSPP